MFLKTRIVTPVSRREFAGYLWHKAFFSLPTSSAVAAQGYTRASPSRPTPQGAPGAPTRQLSPCSSPGATAASFPAGMSRNRGRAGGAPPGPRALPGAEQSGRISSHVAVTLILFIHRWVMPHPPAVIRAQLVNPQILRSARVWKKGMGPAGQSSTGGAAPCPRCPVSAVGSSRRGTGQRAAALALSMGEWGHG